MADDYWDVGSSDEGLGNRYAMVALPTRCILKAAEIVNNLNGAPCYGWLALVPQRAAAPVLALNSKIVALENGYAGMIHIGWTGEMKIVGGWSVLSNLVHILSVTHQLKVFYEVPKDG